LRRSFVTYEYRLFLFVYCMAWYYVRMNCTTCERDTDPDVAVTVTANVATEPGRLDVIVSVDVLLVGLGVRVIVALVGRPATEITAPPFVVTAVPLTETVYTTRPPFTVVVFVTGVTVKVISALLTPVMVDGGSVLAAGVGVMDPVVAGTTVGAGVVETINDPVAVRVNPPPVPLIVNGYVPTGTVAATVRVNTVLVLLRLWAATVGATPAGSPAMLSATGAVKVATFATMMLD
jgi:hypothetical protein